MQDSASAANLHPGYPAYVGYIDGLWPTYSEVVARFPGAHVLSLTTGLGDADGIDVEPGNEGWNDGCAAVPGWVRARLDAGVDRPAVYISASYGSYIINKLAAAGVSRWRFRLFLAHWWNREHICGTDGCPYPAADATQWIGGVDGANGYDLSLCADNFFGAATTPAVKPRPSTPAVASPSDKDEDDNMDEYLVETRGATVKARPEDGRRYPEVSEKQVFVVDADGKRQVFGGELPLRVALFPASRQFLGDKARPCSELADTPSVT